MVKVVVKMMRDALMRCENIGIEMGYVFVELIMGVRGVLAGGVGKGGAGGLGCVGALGRGAGLGWASRDGVRLPARKIWV